MPLPQFEARIFVFGGLQMRAKLRTFIESNFYVPEGQVLADDASLLDSGVIDSTGVLELVGFLQDEIGVEVADDDIIPENLDSIAKIESFVMRKQKAA
jgi:acyl carrier protein